MEFEDIYREYFRDVYLFLRSLSANADIAEEVAQQAFEKALGAIDRFDGRSDVRAWLFTIARNTYYSHLRAGKKLSPLPPGDVNAAADSFVGRMADEETAFAAHRLLHDMREPYKEVFMLRVFGELSFERIGSLFGKSAAWARVTYFRARRMLAGQMEAEYEKDKL